MEDYLGDPLGRQASLVNLEPELRGIVSSPMTSMRMAVRLLESPLLKGESLKSLPELAGCPPSLKAALRSIATSLASAHPRIVRAVPAQGAQNRGEMLEVLNAIITNEIPPRRELETFERLKDFRLDEMLTAASQIMRAVEATLPGLKAAKPEPFERLRWTFPFGDILLSGPGDDSYTDKDLDGVALLVDMGGNNEYTGHPAAAGARELRVVIDLGKNVRVEGDRRPSSGSGIFGVGLFYLPNPQGRKIFDVGDYSLGSGFFGVGALILDGEGNHLEGHRFTQGAALMGLGLLRSRGKDSHFDARLAGQGFGMTRGLGLFLHRGDRAQVNGGLYYPDPREDKALISLCQGMGYGPRAFAAGGIGLAYLEGNDMKLKASYMAQGTGYWHGLGGLFIKGDSNTLQARRYSQGAGVHTAAGFFNLRGDRNITVNWGVGPGFGWDRGIGLFLSSGDDNRYTAEWGSTRGDANGHGLARIRGDRNKIGLVQFGTGASVRSAPSYGIALVEGQGNTLLSPWKGDVRGSVSTDPWGVVHSAQKLGFDPGMKTAKTAWSADKRMENLKATLKTERSSMEDLLRLVSAGPLERKIGAYLSILSYFSLDSATPARVSLEILSLDPAGAATLPSFITPERFIEMIWMRIFIGAHGRPAAEALVAEVGKSRGLRKAILVGHLSSTTLPQAAPTAFKALKDDDRRVRRAGIMTLGSLLNRELGETSGRMTFLEAALQACALPKGEEVPESLYKRIAAKRLSELFPLLALDPALSKEDRKSLFLSTRNPFDRLAPGSDPIKKALSIVRERCPAYIPALKAELRAEKKWKNRVRKRIKPLLKDSNDSVAHAAITALGMLGRGKDASAIAGHLGHRKALLREGAAKALGRLGAAGKAAIDKAMRSDDPLVRAMAAVAAAHSSDAGVVALLENSFNDRDDSVRRKAIGALFALPPPRTDQRKDFLGKLRELSTDDPSPSVRASAGIALSRIAPPSSGNAQ